VQRHAIHRLVVQRRFDALALGDAVGFEDLVERSQDDPSVCLPFFGS